MAKTPKKPKAKAAPKPKVQRSAHSKSRAPRATPAGHAPLGDPAPVPAPCNCCPDCAGKPSGTMGGCEDGVCRDIPPPQGEGPWVLFWHSGRNGNFPYWESVRNVLLVGRMPEPAPEPHPAPEPPPVPPPEQPPEAEPPPPQNVT